MTQQIYIMITTQ